MPDLTPALAPDVLAACQAGAGEAASAVGRTFDLSVTLTPGEPGAYDAAKLGLAGPGLVVLLQVGGAAALVLLAESTGLLPEWYANPDPTGVSKLTTLAQELGMLLLPESCMPDDFRAARVADLARAVEQGGVAAGAGWLPLEIKTTDDRAATLHLIWPAPKPADVFAATSTATSSAPAAAPVTPAAPEPTPKPAAAKPAAPPPKPKPAPRDLQPEDLPAYSQNLLRIRVPVTATLAATKLPVRRILELVPGTIIQFSKSCEDMLELNAGNQKIAEGEAVKVGEKFGLRITSLALPDERFESIKPQRAGR